MIPFTSLSIFMLAGVQLVNADFHLITRYKKFCDIECSKKDVCHPTGVIEWSVGGVPSSQFGCDGFKNDNYFPSTLSQNGEGFDYNGFNMPDICGSGSVDLWVVNDGQQLDVWRHGANPGELLASCYNQTGDKIVCGQDACDTTEAHDAWVCTNTSLCS